MNWMLNVEPWILSMNDRNLASLIERIGKNYPIYRIEQAHCKTSRVSTSQQSLPLPSYRQHANTPSDYLAHLTKGVL